MVIKAVTKQNKQRIKKGKTGIKLRRGEIPSYEQRMNACEVYTTKYMCIIQKSRLHSFYDWNRLAIHVLLPFHFPKKRNTKTRSIVDFYSSIVKSQIKLDSYQEIRLDSIIRTIRK